MLNACICYNHRHAGFFSPAPAQCLCTVASVSGAHMNAQVLMTSWQKPGQSTEAKCLSLKALPILWIHWHGAVSFLSLDHSNPSSLTAAKRCVLHHQSFLHTDHQASQNWDDESGTPDVSYHLVKQNMLLLSTEPNTWNKHFLKAGSCTGLQQTTFNLLAVSDK